MNEPFSATVRVLERHKIRLSKDIYCQIPFLAEKTPETIQAVAMAGPFGGIQVIFQDSMFAASRNRIQALIKKGQATADAATENWMLLARYLSNTWPLTLSFHDRRYTLVLPNTARELGLVPKNEGEEALVFVCGNVLEIWRPQAWINLIQDTRAKLARLEEDLADS